MTILLYIFQVLFHLMALGLVTHFCLSKHIGALLGAIAYGVASVSSFKMMAWWPLLVGFGAAWIIRALGLDPGAASLEDEENQTDL